LKLEVECVIFVGTTNRWRVVDMKGAARFIFGALIGVALGYAFVLLSNTGARRRPSPTLVVHHIPEVEQSAPVEEVAAS
jgi:hypothetical protein